jgi:hypothetical protein
MGWVDQNGSSWTPSPTDTWHPGLTTKTMTVICCPACGSTRTRHKGQATVQDMRFFQCMACNNRWKMTAAMPRPGHVIG